MPRLPSESELSAERERRSLLAFTIAAWPTVLPDEFTPGFHIEAVCEHLEALSSGQISKLLINLPPRHGKSSLISVFWPAWVWASRPETRFLYASYALSLAERDSAASRRLIESPWYQTRWGNRFQLANDQNSKARFQTDQGGHRIATSVGGSATGEGGDFIVIDDPHKIDEATSSAAARENVISWFDSTISTRRNHPGQGGIAVIGHRLHEHDLSGHLLAQGTGFTSVCPPSTTQPTRSSGPTIPAQNPGSRSGQPATTRRRSRRSSAASAARTLPPSSSSGPHRRAGTSSRPTGGSGTTRSTLPHASTRSSKAGISTSAPATTPTTSSGKPGAQSTRTNTSSARHESASNSQTLSPRSASRPPGSPTTTASPGTRS